MSWEGWIARAHRMDDAAWARHANPWSVWTRVPILLLLALAIWSRAWIARGEVPVPERHRLLPHVLNAAAAGGGLLLAYGLAWLVPWAALLGFVLAFGAKMLFLDRMVRLVADMAGDPRLQRWQAGG